MSRRQMLLIVSMCYIVFFSVLSGTMFIIALPEISAEFALTPSGVSWVLVAYSLFFSVGSVAYGKLADLHSVKRLIVIGLLLFAGGSGAGFFAGNYGTVLAARMIMAVGAAAIPALVMVAVTRYFPAGQKGHLMGLVASTVAFGFGVGPVLGGAIAQMLDWRYLFLFSVFSLLALPVLIRSLPNEEPPGGSFDFPGALLFSAGVAALLLGVNTNPWFLPAAALLFLLFALHIRRTDQPFIRIGLFRNRSYRLLLMFGFLIFFSHMSNFFILPLMLKEANGLDAGFIGLAFFPAAFSAALLGTLAGRLSDGIGSAAVLRLSVLALAVGFFAMSTVVGQSVIWIGALLVPAFVGFSDVQAALAGRIAETLESGQTGVGMGLYNLTAFMGGAFGPTIFSVFLELDLNRWNLLNRGEFAAYSNAFLLLAGICLLTLLPLAASRRKARNAMRAEQGDEADHLRGSFR